MADREVSNYQGLLPAIYHIPAGVVIRRPQWWLAGSGSTQAALTESDYLQFMQSLMGQLILASCRTAYSLSLLFAFSSSLPLLFHFFSTSFPLLFSSSLLLLSSRDLQLNPWHLLIPHAFLFPLPSFFPSFFSSFSILSLFSPITCSYFCLKIQCL